MLSDIGLINGKGVCAALTNGRTIKVTVDNIDGRIKANKVLHMILTHFNHITAPQHISVD